MSRHESRASDPYRSCIDWLFARHRFGMKPGLSRVRALLAAVGDPQKRYRIVHVGGTNGKGSTATLVASILSEHGLVTGLYTSPHVVDFTERFSIDGRAIARSRVTELVLRLRPAAEEVEATFFEIVTAAAALYFAEEDVDLVVAEVGLGGRLDATNVFDSSLSVITSVAIDHAEVLGGDIAGIAAEKAGIIRPGGSVVSGADGDALDVLRGVAAARRARFVAVRELATVSRVAVTPGGSRFDLAVDGHGYRDLELSLLGRHQVGNAATALVAALELERLGLVDLREPALRRGLLEARVTGRLQILERRPTVVADVAHNPDAATVLMRDLPEVFAYDRLIVVLGVMADKDLHGIMLPISRAADIVVLTRPATPRAADPRELASLAVDLGVPHDVVPTPGAAIDRALSIADEGDLVLITGSHYTVGDVMKSLGVGQALDA